MFSFSFGFIVKFKIKRRNYNIGLVVFPDKNVTGIFTFVLFSIFSLFSIVSASILTDCTAISSMSCLIVDK